MLTDRQTDDSGVSKQPNNKINKSYVILNLFQDLISVLQRNPESSSGRRARVRFTSRNDEKCWESFSFFSLSSSLHLAFTLAEVLIVLGIVGVVAEMTIPTLVANTQRSVEITGVKKAYSEFTQAYTMATQEDGSPDTWALGSYPGDAQGALNIMNIFAKQLKIAKNCGNDAGCLPDVTYKSLSGTDALNYNNYRVFAKAQLVDGTSIFVFTDGSCHPAEGAIANACGTVGIDINGFKGPNQIGIDVFEFYITPTNLVPYGIPTDGTIWSSFKDNCKDISSATGEGCTGWIIYNNNMDYTKPCGNTLSWDGPNTCN